MTPDDERHGTRRGYYAHRRDGESACDPCKRAAAAEEQRYVLLRNRGTVSRLPAHGVMRRLRALHAMGWSWTELDKQMGVERMAALWSRGEHQYVFPATFTMFADLYNRLEMLRPPSSTPAERRAATRSRRRAQRAGWAPPMAYTNIDDPKDVPLMDDRFTRWDSIDHRFWGRVQKTDTCWLWTGRLTEKGYGGRLGYQKTLYYPHQFSYILHVGPIPNGLVIDHLCRVRHCVNPDHLEPVTAVENTRRGAEARWLEACPNDHDPSFRSKQPSGKVRCSECEREGGRRYYERNKEAALRSSRDRYAQKQKRLDEVVVDRLMRGERVEGRATKAERLEVVRRWQASGRPLNELEKLHGWNVAREVKALRGSERESA